MAEIDYERAWSKLSAYACTKRSHGQDGLLAEMKRIEVECAVPEGQQGYDPSPEYRRFRTPPAVARPVANGGRDGG